MNFDPQGPVRKAATQRASALHRTANFILFQAGWFACVLGAASGDTLAIAGTAAAMVVVAIHIGSAKRAMPELKLALVVTLIGLLWEALVLQAGWLAFPYGNLTGGWPPIWILAMWALLATTLNVSLDWLKGRWLLAVVLGAVAGPLSYYAGMRMGAVEFIDAPRAIATLAVGWGALTPLLLLLAHRLDGVTGLAGAQSP